MILQSLVQCYETLLEQGEVAQDGISTVKVYYELELSPQGELLNVLPVYEEITVEGKPGKNGEKKTKTITKPQQRQVPMQETRASGVKPYLLADRYDYLLGFAWNDPKKDKAALDKNFPASKQMHLEFLKPMDDPAAQAVCAFFEQWDPQRATEHPVISRFLESLVNPADIERGQFLFRVDGKPVDLSNPALRQTWERQYNEGAEDNVTGLCLVTGEQGPIARLHGKIRGVSGGQAAGTNLVSINANAFASYGTYDISGAPVGRYAAFAYVTALNKLLSDSKHMKLLGDTSVVYWEENGNKQAEEAIGGAVFGPEPERTESPDLQLDELFQKIAKKEPMEGVTFDVNAKFYVLGLVPNGGRLSVSFFYQNTVGNMISNIQQHYQRLEIVRPKFAAEEKYLSPYFLLKEMVNPNSKDKKPPAPLVSGLMRAILQNAEYPTALFQQVMLRIRAEREVNWKKAAMIKAYFLQKLKGKEREVLSVSLNRETDDKAYLLGRLFALLEQVQIAASKDGDLSKKEEINRTILDRFLDGASANPRRVFPTILKLDEHHLKKLRRSNAGLAVNYAKEKGAILYRLEVGNVPFPQYLSREEQGKFLLGYYHQKQYFYIKNETKQDGKTVTESEEK